MSKISDWYHEILGEIEKLFGMEPGSPAAVKQKGVVTAKVQASPLAEPQKAQVLSVASAAAASPVPAGTGPTGATGATGATG